MSTILIFGAGPGIGNHVASTFASHKFAHILLISRNVSQLQATADSLTSTNPELKVSTLPHDLSDIAAIPDVLQKIEALAPEIDVVFFNAARIKPSEVLTTSVEELDEDFRTTNLSLYLIAQWAVPKLLSIAKSDPKPKNKPSLLVTSSHLPYSPIPQLLSLSLVKASQRNMVQSLSLAYGEDDVHIGLVTVEGQVAPENKVLNPKNIADKAWGFYEEGKGFEVKLKED